MKKSLVILALSIVFPFAASAELGLYGWGLRVGLADDPDQFVIGVHQDLGEIVENLRLQPSLEAGFGDDHTIISGTIPVHYRFDTPASVTPYVGGGVRVDWIDRETRRRDDTDLEISPVAIGGAEWKLGKTSDLFVELHLSPGDAHEAKVVVGWMFRAP